MSGNKIDNPKAAVVMTKYSIIAGHHQVTQLVMKFDVINGFEDRNTVAEFMAAIDKLCEREGKK